MTGKHEFINVSITGNYIIRSVYFNPDDELAEIAYSYDKSSSRQIVYSSGYKKVTFDPVEKELIGKRVRNGYQWDLSREECRKLLEKYGEELVIWIMSDIFSSSINIEDGLPIGMLANERIIQNYKLGMIFPYMKKPFLMRLATLIAEGETFLDIPDPIRYINKDTNSNEVSCDINLDNLPVEMNIARMRLNNPRLPMRVGKRMKGHPGMLPATYFKKGNKVVMSTVGYRNIDGSVTIIDLNEYIRKTGISDDIFVAVNIHIPSNAVDVWLWVDKPVFRERNFSPNVGTLVYEYHR